MTSADDVERLRPYVPRLVVDWLREDPTSAYRCVDGSLAFVDISGFTTLTERLARAGKVGAEIMSDALSATFSALLTEAYDEGAGLVKWGGDAVLLLFDGPGHAARAARASVRMRRTLRTVGRIAAGSGFVQLRMSVGIHTGPIEFLLVGDEQIHRELIIAGPGASAAALAEQAAVAGQIGLSPSAADALPASTVDRSGPLPLVRRAPASDRSPAPPAPDVTGLDIARVLSPPMREHLLAGGAEPEHRRVAVGFVQFRGTDALSERGCAEFAAGVDAVVRTVQHACAEQDITFFETDIDADGGKFMLVAGAPAARGDHVDRMLAAARHIVTATLPLPVRVGVNCGPVFSGDFGPAFRRTYSIKGDAVNTAARTMGKASNGEVLATEAAIAESRAGFLLTWRDPVKVKGKRDPLRLALVGPVERAGAPLAAGVVVGREAELAELSAIEDAARAGQGACVAVTGPAGIGKSVLLRAAFGQDALWVALSDRTAQTAYWPWRVLLRQLIGAPDDASAAAAFELLTAAAQGARSADLPLVAHVLGAHAADATDDAFRAQRTAAATARLLTALARPGKVLIVDDAEHMDAASREVLRELRAAVASTGTVVATASREPIDADLTLTLPAVDERTARAIVLAARGGVLPPPHRLSAMLERAAGNPLFLTSLANHEGEELPTSVDDIIVRQIDALPAADRALLRTLAALGMTVYRREIAALASEGDQWADPARLTHLDAFLVPLGRDRLRFRHAVIRDSAYAGLAYKRRRDLHGSIARIIASQPERPGRDGLLALHLFEAGDYAAALPAARAAAETARAAGAHHLAADELSRALACVRRGAPVTERELSELHEMHGDALLRIGDFDGAVAAYRRARGGHVDAVRAAGLLLDESLGRARAGAHRQALALLARGRHLVSERTDRPALAVRSQLSANRAWLRHKQGRYRDAYLEALAAKADATAAEDRAALAEAYGALAQVAAWSRYAAEEPYGERALELYTELGDRLQQANMANNLAGMRFFAGRWAEATELFDQARAGYEAAGDTLGAAIAAYNLGDVALRRGQLSEAQQVLGDVAEVAASLGETELIAAVARERGRAAALAGDTAAARELLAGAIEQFDTLGASVEILIARTALVECDLVDGDADSAIASLDELDPQADRYEASTLTPTLRRLRAVALLRLGRAAEAALVAAPSDDHEGAFLDATRAIALAELGDSAAPELRADAARRMTALGADDVLLLLPGR